MQQKGSGPTSTVEFYQCAGSENCVTEAAGGRDEEKAFGWWTARLCIRLRRVFVSGGGERVDAILSNSMVALEVASMKIQRVAFVGMAQRTRAMLRETYETGTLGRTQR